MTNSINQNEQLKRSFFQYLARAKGFASVSVRAFAAAIWQYQSFTKNDDFANFNRSTAAEFITSLETRASKTTSGRLSVVSRDNYIRRVRKFFEWLACQPGYKSRVRATDVEYLRLSRRDAQTARCGTTKTMPTFDEAKKIIQSIVIHDELDLRDRALISFALITGSRISAIISLKVKNFDERERTIDQNPGDGVRTKNSKRIVAAFFPIGWSDPERYFVEWYAHIKMKQFGPEDPIFPSTESGFGAKDSVGRTFWAGPGAARKIFEKRCADAGVRYCNPHSFRHLIVSVMDKLALTERQKKAISLNLGHANVGTTFGSYGYGHMTPEEATKIIRELESAYTGSKGQLTISKEERAMLEGILKRCPVDPACS